MHQGSPGQDSLWEGTQCHRHSVTQLPFVWKHRCNEWTGIHQQWPHSRLSKPSTTINAWDPSDFSQIVLRQNQQHLLVLDTSPPSHHGTLLGWWPLYHYVYFLPPTTIQFWVVFKITPLTINDPLCCCCFAVFCCCCCLLLFLLILGAGENNFIIFSLTINSRSIPAFHQLSLKSSLLEKQQSCNPFSF